MQSTYEEQCRSIDLLAKLDPTSKEYKTVLDNFKLMTELEIHSKKAEFDISCQDLLTAADVDTKEAKLKADKENRYFGISKDVVVTVLAQSLVSVLALNFERYGVITSKIFRAPAIK